MMIPFSALQAERTGADVAAQVRQVDERREALVRATLRSGVDGTVGIFVRVPGYGPYFPQVGSSPAVVDNRGIAQAASVNDKAPPSKYHDVSLLPAADQARELLAALSLNKSQLADVLRVSRPTLYDWLDGTEPSIANAKRMALLLRVLARSGVTSATPLNARYVRQPLSERAPSLLDALCAERPDEHGLTSLMREAQALGDAMQVRRRTREDRLRALGYDEPSEEQAKDQLARNIALRDWPKR